MKPRAVAVRITLALGILAAPLVAGAQQPGKVYRIGILPPGPISPRMHLWDAFRRGLRDLGYVEGQNLTLIIRSPERGPEQLPDLAAELVGLKVDVIVTATGPGILAAKEATKVIPIVMAVVGDPVDSGFITSLARPGANITGLSLISPELAGKRLELLREVVPRVSRVGVLLDPANPANAPQMKQAEVAARSLGVKLQGLEVRSPSDFERAFEAATRARAGALFIPDSALFYTHRTRIVELAAKHRLAAMYGIREFVESGGLISYGASIPDMYRRAATYVDKILKGAKPADLPVEQPTRFELVINLKTAKALGLTIPQSVLIRADQVIQ
jgi:putative ABC transport system substrate-binding protein